MENIEKVIKGLEFTKAMITFNPSTGEDIEPGNLNELNKTTYDACVGAIALLKEHQPKTGHWVAKTNVCWHENEDDDAAPVFYATLTCSECGKPYSNEVAHTFVDYDEWESAYIPNEPFLNDRRIPIYNKTLEKHIENLKSFRCDWVSCPYCGAKMEKQP